MHRTALFVATLALLVAAGCGGGGAPSSSPAASVPAPSAPVKKAAPPDATPFSPALATGTITGVVKLAGDAPKREAIDFGPNVDCAQAHTEPLYKEDIVAKDGKLANVVVYVKTGYEKWSYEPPTMPMVLDQKGCQYRPHAFALMVGQPLEIMNSDPWAHNIHAKPVENNEFNLSQATAGMKTTKRFKVPEVGIRITCDVHKWMFAYASVFEHPFFAVTGADGQYEIKLPPGEYELATWHESALDGPKAKLIAPVSVKVTVGDKPVTQDFEYKVAKSQ